MVIYLPGHKCNKSIVEKSFCRLKKNKHYIAVGAVHAKKTVKFCNRV